MSPKSMSLRGALMALSLLFLPTTATLESKTQTSFTVPSQQVSELSSLTSEYTTLSHAHFPHHSARIRKNPQKWCDPSVNSYSGFIDTSGARHYFFYFFESRRSPEKDDVVLWTNGGPGGSSTLGLFMEQGPCRVVSHNETVVNEHAWNEVSNIFFIDQPINVGFSYADYNETAGTTEEASGDIAAFVAMFFTTFSEYKGRPFHLSGESYAGRYLPVYASAILEQNKRLAKDGLEPVNLKSVLIGNGFTNVYEMDSSYYDMMCTPASITPIAPIASCVRIKTALPRVQKAFHNSCIETFDEINCRAAMNFFESEIIGPYQGLGRTVYDISKKCEVKDFDFQDCYPLVNDIAAYMDQPSTRTALGTVNKTFNLFSSVVATDFGYHLDEVRVQTQFYVEQLLDRDVEVLIYVGNLDLICNWVGNFRMVEALEWSGKEAFAKEELKSWSVRGREEQAGRFKKAGRLTFLTVEGAGHMVPYDKPVEALDMFSRWIGGESFEN